MPGPSVSVQHRAGGPIAQAGAAPRQPFRNHDELLGFINDAAEAAARFGQARLTDTQWTTIHGMSQMLFDASRSGLEDSCIFLMHSISRMPRHPDCGTIFLRCESIFLGLGNRRSEMTDLLNLQVQLEQQRPDHGAAQRVRQLNQQPQQPQHAQEWQQPQPQPAPRGSAEAAASGADAHARPALGRCLQEVDQAMDAFRAKLGNNGAKALGIEAEMQALEKKLTTFKQYSPNAERGGFHAKHLFNACDALRRAIDAHQSPQALGDPGSEANEVKARLAIVSDATGLERQWAAPQQMGAHPPGGPRVERVAAGDGIASNFFARQSDGDAFDAAAKPGPAAQPPNDSVRKIRQYSKVLQNDAPGISGICQKLLQQIAALAPDMKPDGDQAKALAHECDVAQNELEKMLPQSSGYGQQLLIGVMKTIESIRDETGCPPPYSE